MLTTNDPPLLSCEPVVSTCAHPIKPNSLVLPHISPLTQAPRSAKPVAKKENDQEQERREKLEATNERVRRHRFCGAQRHQTPANWADIFQLPIHLQFRRKTSRWNPAADAKFLRNALGTILLFWTKMSLSYLGPGSPTESRSL